MTSIIINNNINFYNDKYYLYKSVKTLADLLISVIHCDIKEVWFVTIDDVYWERRSGHVAMAMVGVAMSAVSCKFLREVCSS